MRRIILSSLFFLFTWQVIIAQQKVYMPFFEILNIHPDYQYSLSRLFQKYVNDQGKYEIVLPTWNNEPYPSETKDITQSKASEMGVPYFIKGDLNALGDLIIVTMSMFTTDNGEETWNSILKANKMDDLDPILVTLAKNLGEKKVTSTADDIYNVTEQEGKELSEVETKICGGLLLGGAFFGGSLSPGIGGLITYDNRTIIYGLDFVGFTHQENGLAYLDITVDKPFTTSKNTGFAGGGLGYGMMNIEDPDTYSEESNNGGLMLLGGGGVILNRTASVRLIIGSRIFVPLFKVNNKINPGINFFLALNISRKSKRSRR